jgi:hypothetical protein
VSARSRRSAYALILLGIAAAWCAAYLSPGASAAPQTRNSAPPTKEQLQFFESRIRPIFAEHCYQCHSGANDAPTAGLALDWKGGWEKGSDRGTAIIPGDADKSLLIKAVRYTDPDLQMPPGEQLSAAQVNDLIAWIKMGAPDPRTTPPGGGTAPGYGGRGKEHWAFKPVARPSPPAVKNQTWVENDVDRFILAKLEASGMTPNGAADKRTLIRRVYYDLIGLPPTPEQVRVFLADSSPNAFEKVVDSLLASPRYGERWGRHWLDVARYSDSKGQHDRRRESSLYPYAWTYRDYVIQAFNNDLPYDQFIREQLAADRLNYQKNPFSLAALGFLTLGDRFNGQLSDVINDRIDVTSKAFLGLTVTCARCHDHKFDPIPTADYYSLYGIFASSVEPREKPVIGTFPATQAEYLVRRRELDERIRTMRDQNITDVFGDYKKLGAVYLLATTMGANERAAYLKRNGAAPDVLQNWVQFTRAGGRPAVAIFGVWNALSRVPAARFAQQAPRVLANQYAPERQAMLSPVVLKAFQSQTPRTIADVAEVYGKLFARTDPEWEEAFSIAVGDAVFRFLPPRARNQYFQVREQSDRLEMVDPGAPARANVLLDSPAPKDSPILVRGQAETPGPVVPRRFLEVLSEKNRAKFRNGSGRLELANAIGSKANPLTARVLVNRVWQHHFGEGFVSTPDDLGNQSAPPSHPELLDWLATRFMADEWSIKKLHKVMLLSATWQQSSRNNPQFAEKDPFNRLLWRANIRRLEFEPLRDSILSIGGGLDLTIGGHPVDLSEGTRIPQGRGAAQLNQSASLRLSTAPRRSIYGFVDRGDLSEVLNNFDFASPDAPMGKRYETTVPQQALFLMNSPLVIEQVRNVVNRDVFQNASSDEERIQFLYELYFQRPPTDEEVRAGKEFVAATQPSAPAAGDPNAGRAGPFGRAGRGGPGRGAVQGRGQARGRGAPPQAPRIPLTGWQEYAHALLLTNEAAFVK